MSSLVAVGKECSRVDNRDQMDNRGHLTTEVRNPRSRFVGQMSVGEAFDLINAEDATVARAVAAERADICAAIELVVDALRVAALGAASGWWVGSSFRTLLFPQAGGLF